MKVQNHLDNCIRTVTVNVQAGSPPVPFKGTFPLLVPYKHAAKHDVKTRINHASFNNSVQRRRAMHINKVQTYSQTSLKLWKVAMGRLPQLFRDSVLRSFTCSSLSGMDSCSPSRWYEKSQQKPFVPVENTSTPLWAQCKPTMDHDVHPKAKDLRPSKSLPGRDAWSWRRCPNHGAKENASQIEMESHGIHSKIASWLWAKQPGLPVDIQT